ncbi:DNA polymerase III subunit epsilon [Microvirga vignae]|uniref:DNA polymerase III subunit epsilon n=1 Tax=Microvirga vignae TaxID=1225564 RepID=A0A0H1RH27_9HYPH|nr:DNA polymerase III subunit epsilon [Microvirga vignae]
MVIKAKHRSEVFKAPDYETAARMLEATGDYRVLRRLTPRPIVVPCTSRRDEKIAVIVDTETTGLNHTRDEVIELGMVAFTYNEEGRIGDVIGTFNALREPSVPISPEITRLTGIAPDMVAGQVLDLAAVERFIEPADLVIAHNARFDRPFCECLSKSFQVKAWACSHSEIAWSGFGFEGSKLGYLLTQCGWFHQGHRAVEDCHALLEVLAAPLPSEAGLPFGHLLASARKVLLRIWAEGSPFDMKDMLKARGYRWDDGTDGRPKAWWVEVDEEAGEAELAFLQREVYRREVEPFTQRITAFERFRSAR